LIQIVRIVGTDLDLVVGQAEQAWEIRIRAIHHEIERSARQATEIPQPFRLIERKCRRLRTQQHFTGVRQ